ncbi:MAG: FAD-dependent oxidoreductase [bacterium]
MDQETQYDVIIVGGGPGGSTAALYAARANLRTLVIDKALTDGALAITHKIANYPGILEELTGQELLDRMVAQAKHFGAEYQQKLVIGADLGGPIKSIFTGTGDHYTTKAVIAATGALGRSNPLPGESEYLGRGVSYCATCDGAFYRDKVVAVAGDGDHAWEEAHFLTKFAREVHVLVPGKEMKGDPTWVAMLRETPSIKIHLGTRVTGIEGGDFVDTVATQSEAGTSALAADGAFLYLKGNKPITQWLGEAFAMGEGGCLMVNAEMQTAVEGVFAVGDLLCTDLKQAVIAAADGCTAAMAADKYINRRARARRDYN